MSKISFASSPFKIITAGYISLSLFFAFLYCIPVFHTGNLTFLDAWFLSSSALSTTGLTTVTVSDALTAAGSWILVLEMQIGGIGVMGTIGFYIFLMQREASLPQLTLMGLEQNQRSLRNVRRLVIFITLFFLVSETIGVCLLLPDILAQEPSVSEALRKTIFTSVSSFTHSGFDLYGGSVIRFAASPLFLSAVSLLVLLGGIGFPTVWELLFLRKKKKSLYTKVNLLVHGALLLLGILVFAPLEWANPNTLGPLSATDKLVNSLFLSVGARNAGITNTDIAAMAPASVMIMLFLMFIGGSSSSASGGIRTTTFAILISKGISAFSGGKDVVIFRKSLYEEDVQKAYLVFCLMLGLFLSACFFLLIAEPSLDPMAVTFEAMSALTNTGYSFGITADLSPHSKVFIALLMIVGRIGIISIIYSMVKPRKRALNYLKESIIVG
ncbi:potassium transporter TrkG [Paenibacillus thermotolerans]|uniref:potassium transporter TrkG n=1 Tax=Paenibacillus thermotolerans TaxID=3027807 RepID=UPI00236837B3|nr:MULTISPECIES: potassium transporter TrkG [unclassified Paenibacillus]